MAIKISSTQTYTQDIIAQDLTNTQKSRSVYQSGHDLYQSIQWIKIRLLQRLHAAG